MSRNSMPIPAELAALGFANAEDDDNPGLLYHRCGVQIFVDTPILQVVELIYKRGMDVGSEEVRTSIRRVLRV